MFKNNQNTINQRPSKLETEVERFYSLSGQVYEITWSEQLVFEDNDFRKVRISDVNPPLADRRKPQCADDIRDCSVCLRTYHKDNVLECPNCGKYFCKDGRCKGTINQGDTETIVCGKCAKWENAGFIGKMFMKLWDLGS